jgi:hypothetical protein
VVIRVNILHHTSFLNIENKFQSSAGRSELENSQPRDLIKTHQDTITLMVPHAELNEVRP